MSTGYKIVEQDEIHFLTFQTMLIVHLKFAVACNGGNVSWTSWSRQNKADYQRYFYNYDGLNRLTSATYTTTSPGGDNRDEYYGYDKMGNITYLCRYDSHYGYAMDVAVISYEGNQLRQLNDFGDTNKGFGYSWEEEQFAYNRNAALTKDIHRGIDSIRYNYMNLPKKIWFDNGNYNEYLYDATGTKRRVTYGTMEYSFSIPGGTGTAGQQSYLATDYCGSVIYENGQLSRVLNPEGYTYFVPVPDTYIYYYFTKYYQGSVRAVTQFLSFMQGRWPVGHTDYYPYGLPFGEEGNPEHQPYKREGKELDEMHGLNWYDQGARFFGSDLPVTPTMDPLAEKYYGVTPYAQWANNPVRYVDLRGDSISVAEEYREQFMSDMQNAFGGKASSLSFNASGNLVLDGKAKDFTKGMSKDQKSSFKGLNKAMTDKQTTSVVYADNYDLTVGGEVRSVDIVGEFGGGVYSKTDNTIVISPNVGSVNVTLDQIQLGFSTQNVQQNTTSALFHEIGERNTTNINFRGTVIDYENYVRRIIGLPVRPYDLNHSKTIRTYYTK